MFYKIKKYFTSNSRFKELRILIVLIILGAILRLYFAFRPFNDVILYSSDDAFYYFQVALNFAKGKGVTFNDGITTNGFHPLYFIFLVPIFYFSNPTNINLAIYVILFILTLFDIGTAVLLYYIGTYSLNKKAGILACIFWLFNPFIISTTFMGLEAPIQVFFIASLIFFFVKYNNSQYTIKQSIFIALLIVLISYSRLDGIFMLVGVSLSLFIKKYRVLKKHRSYKRVLQILKSKDFLIISVIPLFFFLIWIVWSYLNIGIFTPISGHNLNLVYFSEEHLSGSIVAIEQSVAFPINLFFFPPGMRIIQIFIAFLIFGIPIIIILYKWLFKEENFIKILLRKFHILLFTLILFFFYYWFILVKVKPWYAHFINFCIIIFYSIILVHIIDEFKKKKHEKRYVKKLQKNSFSITLILFFCIFFLNGIEIVNHPYGDANLARLEVAQYIDNNIPENETIGSFNTGIVQFYSQNHDVLNLDGLINPEAFFAIQNNSIIEYIIRKNITYIVDPLRYVIGLNGSQLNVVIVEEFQYEVNSYTSPTGIAIKKYYLFRITVI